MTTAAGCDGAFPQGAYQGDGSSCPGLCLQDGACCFTDGTCAFLHFGPCNVGDGTFQGDSTTCIPNLCPPPAPVPTQINHQGVVSVNGQRFTGTGRFYFAIIDPDTGNSVWTNDATNIGTPNRPNQPVAIACANGLYDVRLGDLSYLNMKPIPVDVFSSETRALRIWFNDGTNGVFQLTPDHVLTSTPYAMRAAETGSGIPITRVYTANDTWIKPQGLKYMEVELVGGGGGGGGSTTANVTSSGGAGGGYSKKTISVSSLGAIEAVTVGAGGTAGTGNGGNGAGGTGGTGGTSSFGTSPFLSATGGNGGRGAGVALGSGATGGIGSGGDINCQGSPGEKGNNTSGPPNQPSGFGGSSVLGGGAPSSYVSGGESRNNGGPYGGGGSGAQTETGNDSAGGVGAAGVVIVTEYY